MSFRLLLLREIFFEYHNIKSFQIKTNIIYFIEYQLLFETKYKKVLKNLTLNILKSRLSNFNYMMGQIKKQTTNLIRSKL